MPNEVATQDSQTGIVGAPPKAGAIAIGERGLKLGTLDDAFRFAQYVVQSGLAPNGCKNAADALVRMQTGAELGFSPMQALSVVYVIGGRGCIMGEGVLAKIRSSGICTYGPMVGNEFEGEARLGFIEFKRRDLGEQLIRVTFTIAEAKEAGLLSKWPKYFDDMLVWRAVARAGRRYFSDVLRGMSIVEEVRDYEPRPGEPTPRDVTPPAAPDPLLALDSPARRTPLPPPTDTERLEIEQLRAITGYKPPVNALVDEAQGAGPAGGLFHDVPDDIDAKLD